MISLLSLLQEITSKDLVRNSNRGGNDFFPKQIRYIGWVWRRKEAIFNTGKYIQRVQLPEIKTISRLKGSDQEKVSLGLDGDVKVSCTCGDWLYGGFKYMGTQTDYSIDPENRFPEVRNPRTIGSVCKHLTYLLNRLPNYKDEIAEDYTTSKNNGYTNVRRLKVRMNKKTGKVLFNK